MIMIRNDVDVIGWGDIPARVQRLSCDLIDPEVFGVEVEVTGNRKTPTHRQPG
jgi:hypothetical protein